MTTWFEQLGFTDNPFYLEPVSAEGRTIAKGFVDRMKERSSAEDFAQLKEGKLLLLGHIGEGKSSLLNLLQYNAEKDGRLVLRIDLLNAQTKEAFTEALLTELQRKSDKIPGASKDKLNRKLDELNISRKKEKKGTKITSAVEGKLGALIAYVKAKVSGEEIEEEEIEYYVPPRIRRLQGLVEHVLPAIFDSTSPILLCENLEKLPIAAFKQWVKQTVNLLPSNVLLAATANINELDSDTLKMCYDNFSIPLQMEKIGEITKLREFIEGRMINYSMAVQPPIKFDDGAITALLDRTGGNLRESFRYCYSALQKFKRDISADMMIEAMTDVDAPRFEVLNETDRKLLGQLTSGSQFTLDEIVAALEGEEGKDAIRKRLDNLATSGLLKKGFVKSGRAYKVTYAAPNTVAKIWMKRSSS